MLGLAAGAGVLAPGTEQVRESVRTNRAHFVLVAGDVSANTREKLVPLLAARSVPWATVSARAALGAAVGRPPASALAVEEAGFARRLRDLLAAARGD